MKRKAVSGIMLTLLLTSMLTLAFNIQPAKAGSFTSANGVTGTTYVEGNITADTTWTTAGSPYVVTGNILVKNGVTLTIEPGVVVKFNSAKMIQVDGQLVAMGMETEPILFTSNHPSPVAGYWAGIEFTDSSVDASYDEAGNYLSGSVMQYCNIEYGGGSSPALKMESASPLIDNCVIKNNNSPGIYVSKGSPKITNSIITNNSISISSNTYGGGIYASGDGTIISGNILTNNSISAISTWSYHYNAYGGGIYASGRITIDDNVIMNNSALGIGNPFYGADAYGGGIYASGLVTISNNIVTDNLAFGSYADVNGGGIYASGAVTISNNIVANNSASGSDRYGGGIYASGEGTIISGNIITNNSVSGGTVTGWTYAYGGGIYVSGDEIVVSDNFISYNSALNSYGYGCGGGIYATGNGVNINGNSITNNTVSGRDAYSGRRFAARGGGVYASGAAAINGNIIAYNSAYSRSDGGYTVDAFGGGVYGSGSVAISNNKIANNFALDCGGGIYGGDSVTNNSIINNWGSEGGGIYGSATMSSNTIMGNRISRGQGKGGGICISGQSSINYNNIYGCTPYDVYNSNPQSSPDVDASNNWWGTIIDAQIQENIYDWFDDASLGIVNYIPYLATTEITAPISPPTGLSATAEDSVIQLSWSANPETDLAGYKVYYDIDSGYPYDGTGANEGSSGIDVGNVTNYQLSGLRNGITYYIAITAYDSSGDEGWYSNEVILKIVVPDFSIMASPTSLTIQQGNSDTSVITIMSIGGFNQPVDLTVHRVPSGVTATLDPEQVTPPPDGSTTSTLTVSVDTTAIPGSNTFSVVGTNGTLAHDVDISLEITSAPPTLIPGKDVPTEAPDFFTSVLTKLNIPTSQFAVQALTIWTNYENTNAYWNPLATTWDMGEKSWDFNEAGVKNYVDKETGIQATANTLALHYYEFIREMLAIQSFNEQQLREAVATWSGLDPADPYVINLVNEWRNIYPENQPPVADAGPDQSVSSGDVVWFDGSNSYDPDPDGTIVNYRWDFGDGTTAEGKIMDHRFSEPKTYTVTLTVEDDAGATDTDTIYVTVAPLKKTVQVFTRPYVPIGEMTVTYNWVDEETLEDIYIVSKIQVVTKGFTGVCRPQILNHLGEKIWSDFLLIGPGRPYVKEYTFEGIKVRGSDSFGMSMTGIDVITALVKAQLKVTNWYVELVDKLMKYLPIEIIYEMLKPEEIEVWEELPIAFDGSSSTRFYSEDVMPPTYIDAAPDLNIAHFASPGELRVYDSEGRVTGLVNGEVREEIPDSAYFNNTVMILSPSASYRYEVAGTEDGSYGLWVASFVQGEIYNFTATNIPISTNAVHRYVMNWTALTQGQQGANVQVDSDGDGTFEKSFNADNELTRDEFILQVPPAEPFPIWIVGVAVAAIALATAAIAVLWRRRRQSIKE